MLSQHFSGRTKENHETHKPALAEIWTKYFLNKKPVPFHLANHFVKVMSETIKLMIMIIKWWNHFTIWWPHIPFVGFKFCLVELTQTLIRFNSIVSHVICSLTKVIINIYHCYLFIIQTRFSLIGHPQCPLVQFCWSNSLWFYVSIWHY